MSGSGSTTFAVTRSAASAATPCGKRFVTEFGENFWTFVGLVNPSPRLAVAEDAKTA